MLIRNVRIENADIESDVRISDGMICEIGENLKVSEGEKIMEGNGGLMLPPFVDCHVHLDTCLSLDDTGPNISGTLFEGIRVWSEYRKKLTKDEVQKRALRTLKLYKGKGVQYVRSHVDISNDFTAFQALLEFRYIVELVQKYDKLVDIHCDEIDDEQSRFLEVLAAQAHETGMGRKVSASHTTAMHSYNDAYCSKLYRVLNMSGVNIIANPLVNVNLQGRFETYPKRRGITRVKELLENGVNVSLGHDDIYDPFYPLGNGDMIEVLSMGLHLCHMMGYHELNQSYRLITYHGADTLNLDPERYGIAVSKPVNFNIFHGRSFFEVLQKRDGIQYRVRNGKVINIEE